MHRSIKLFIDYDSHRNNKVFQDIGNDSFTVVLRRHVQTPWAAVFGKWLRDITAWPRGQIIIIILVEFSFYHANALTLEGMRSRETFART